jgi:hypothetical protein
MRGFLINAEILLYMSGEEILFDREMGQLNFTCIYCSKAEMQD